MTAASAVVVMGPAGSGKTTVGQRLASRLGWRFIEGDAFHPAANVAKMSSGQPLNDEDRRPWLDRLAAELGAAARRDQNVVLTCSALKASYRDKLRIHAGVKFLFLKAGADVLQQRLSTRKGHFVTVGLLASQLADLEQPGDDAIVVDATLPPDAVVDAARSALTLA